MLAPIKGRPCRLLEIGCFEGRSTLWLLQNVMIHQDSLIYCIDSFKGGAEHQGYDFKAIKARFENNTFPWKEKVMLLEGESHSMLQRSFPPLDFVYVDGSHRADDVYLDAVLAWPNLKPVGLMVFDDYEWDGCQPTEPPTKTGIDRFLETIEGQYETVHKVYQLAIRKLDNKSTAE